MSIDILHVSDQQSVRLLELPPELLASLHSSEERLKLKSPNDASGEAVVCSSNTTWALRQVQSSNTLMLLSPSTVASDAQSLTTFATCNGMIEVLQLKDASDVVGPAEAWLVELLTIYDTGQPDSVPKSIPRTQVVSRVPFSDREVATAWRTLAAFETDRGSYRPSNRCTVSLWEAIVKEGRALSIDLVQPFAFDELFAGTRLEDKYPLGAYEALISKVTGQDNVREGPVTLDREATMDHVGKAIALSLGDTVTAEALRARLLQLMPSAWHDAVDTSTLSRLKSDGVTSVGDSALTTSAAKTDSKRKPNARNWHEKFKKQKV